MVVDSTSILWKHSAQVLLARVPGAGLTSWPTEPRPVGMMLPDVHDYINYIIVDARLRFLLLNSGEVLFPSALVQATDLSAQANEEIYRIYGPRFLTRYHNGTLSRTGLKQYYDLVKRLLYHFTESGFLHTMDWLSAFGLAVHQLKWRPSLCKVAFLWFLHATGLTALETLMDAFVPRSPKKRKRRTPPPSADRPCLVFNQQEKKCKHHHVCNACG